jgi:hypothetical protein
MSALGAHLQSFARAAPGRGKPRAQAAGEMSRDANPGRLARRYRANIATMRL